MPLSDWRYRCKPDPPTSKFSTKRLWSRLSLSIRIVSTLRLGGVGAKKNTRKKPLLQKSLSSWLCLILIYDTVAFLVTLVDAVEWFALPLGYKPAAYQQVLDQPIVIAVVNIVFGGWGAQKSPFCKSHCLLGSAWYLWCSSFLDDSDWCHGVFFFFFSFAGDYTGRLIAVMNEAVLHRSWRCYGVIRITVSTNGIDTQIEDAMTRL